MPPQTPIKESSRQRSTLGISWFPEDSYPTPAGYHGRQDRLTIQDSDEGSSIDLECSSPSSEEGEEDTNTFPQDDFVEYDDDLVMMDEDYVPGFSSSGSEDGSNNEASSKHKNSKKRTKSSGVASDKRRRVLFGHESDATNAFGRTNNGGIEKGETGGKGTQLLGFASDRGQSLPAQHFINLKAENREIHAFSGIEYPKELFEALSEVYAQIQDSGNTHNDDAAATSTTTPPSSSSSSSSPRPGRLYILLEENNRALPYFAALNATADLELANEVALARFRDLCHEHFPRIAAEHFDVFEPGPRDGWARADGDIRRVAKFAWWVGEGGCVALSAAMPGTEFQVVVRVIARRVVSRWG
ncbi:hypothetical protein F5X99DRAFT_406384 [Biscogniauxia marginata]|nr:hypothetical protein F5X99DRAFT_406384 [Biscogniauxia marginata]